MAIPPHVLSTYSSIAHAISSPSSTNHTESPRSYPTADPSYSTTVNNNTSVSPASSPNALLQGQIDRLHRMVKDMNARVKAWERKYQDIDGDIQTLIQCF